MKLKGEVALITGSSRGIGKSIAQLFAKNGATVIVNGTNLEAVEKTVAELTAEGYGAYSCVFDVTDRAGLKAAIETVQETAGKITILVNNSGISPKKNGKPVPLYEMESAEWDHVVDVNLTGVFNCCQAVIPHMIEIQHGKIINISSLAARQYLNYVASHYITTKTAIVGLTRALSGELCQYNVNCNCIAPGRTWTDLTRTLPMEVNEAIAQTVPIKRLAECEEIAAVALFLASSDSSYMHGATVDVNGGFYMN